MGTRTLGNVCEARCQRLRELGRSDHTIKDFERRVRQLGRTLPRGMDTQLHLLSASTLETFERRLRTKGIVVPAQDGVKSRKVEVHPLAPKTCREAMKCIRSLIHFALKRGWLTSDPAVGYELSPAPSPRIEAYNASELGLLYADDVDGMADIWRFFVETCLRVSEFMWLLKDDVLLGSDGQPEALLIRAKHCPLTSRPWKQKHGVERTVPLTDRASQIVMNSMNSSTTPWAFQSTYTCGPQAGKWNYSPVANRLHNRQDAAGITRSGLHRFRHTGATYLANNAAMPIAQLQKFLGHHNLKETQRYLHPRVEHVAAVIRSVDFDQLVHSSHRTK